LKRPNRKYNDYHRTNKEDIEEKQCIDCLEWFEMNDNNFGKDKKSKDGFNIRCKKCQKINQDIYYAKNREAIIEKSKQYTVEHYSTQLAYILDYDKNNPDKRRKRRRKYYELNRDREKQKLVDFFSMYPDKQKEYNENHRDHEITKKEWNICLKIFGDKCAYCGLPQEKHIVNRKDEIFVMNFHKEHVDDKGANDLRNAVPACRVCNSSKHDFDMEEWFRRQEFFDEERLKFIYWWTNEGYKEYIEDKPLYRIVKKQNEHNKKFHHELWIVDEYRNMINLIATKVKKKDLYEDIKEYLNELTINNLSGKRKEDNK